MRMRLFLLVVLHALVISFISIAHPQAEENVWNINGYGCYVVATVPSQVIWRDDKDKVKAKASWGLRTEKI